MTDSDVALADAHHLDCKVNRRAAGEGACAGHVRAALRAMPTGLLTFDAGLQVLLTNERLAATLGIQPAVMCRAATVLDLLEHSARLDEATVEHLHETCLIAVNTGRQHTSTVSVARDGATHRFAVDIVPLEDGHWMASIEDVTQRHAAEESAIDLAMCDPLTGLPNRQLLERRVTTALGDPAPRMAKAGDAGQAGDRLALMVVDLDRFKIVNDTLGHRIGDALLRLVSKRLRSVLRSHDLVARLGGDEFALLITSPPETPVLAQLATRLVNVLGRPYLIEGHVVNVGASVGIAIAPRDGCEHNELLRSADLALYHAKNSGGGSFRFFDPDMDARARARRSLEIDLRKALALRQFELHYQPQIDLETDGVTGFEALLRWRHPERGLVPPDEFIPLAEEIGLIVPIGEWVLREACCEATEWPSTISIAVNVSPRQFEDTAKLVHMVEKALSVSGLPGRRLEIEVTESVLLHNEVAVLTALRQLRGIGVRVAMDDFGTGYSSLSQLHSFPFDKIKIDRSFVTDRADQAGQNAIIRAITALGVSLGMSTIAEGVETTEQLARIRTGGCNSVQGYLFSRPVPIQQVKQLIADLETRRLMPAAASSLETEPS